MDESAETAAVAPADGGQGLGREVSVLYAAGMGSFVLWVIGLVGTTWHAWNQLDTTSQLSNVGDQSSVPALLSAATTQTWGYLLVAVVAYGAAVLLMRSALEPADATPDR